MSNFLPLQQEIKKKRLRIGDFYSNEIFSYKPQSVHFTRQLLRGRQMQVEFAMRESKAPVCRKMNVLMHSM